MRAGIFVSVFTTIVSALCTRQAFNRHLQKQELREGEKGGTEGGEGRWRRKPEERTRVRREERPSPASRGRPRPISQPNYNSQQAPAPRAGLGGSSCTRPQPARLPACLASARAAAAPAGTCGPDRGRGGGAGREAGRGRGRAQAPPPSLPAGLRAPERLLSVCTRGGRVRFGSPFL